jgi:hypothetical protein
MQWSITQDIYLLKNTIIRKNTDIFKDKIDTSRFKSLLESTLGDAKPLVNENDLGLPHPNKTVYKKLFNSKLSEAISEVGTDSEAIYDSLCLKLDDIMENWRYESGDGGKSVWGDDEN